MAGALSAVGPGPARAHGGASAPRVLGLYALWLLATAWLRPLLLPDEGRYAEVAREMLAGDGWVPRLNGLPFFHKPPLTYWVDMAGMALFGPSAFTARLGPLLGAWLLGASLWWALRQRSGPRAAGLALVVVATSPFVYLGGQFANHDMLVAGTVTAAILAFARALEAGDHPQRRWLLAGWAACGLALLAKGLIGLVLPALVIGPWLLAQGRWRALPRLLHPAGLALCAAIALPWFAAAQARYPGFFDYFIVEQHFRRYATAGFNNAQPAWFFFAVLPLLTLPWAGLLPAALRRARAGWTSDRAWTGLLLWWVLAVLLFFSLPRSKLVGYILPALAPWCALLAAPLAEPGGRAARWARPLAGVAALLCLAVVALLTWQPRASHRDVARVLAAQRAPGDLVVLVDGPFQDLQFDARLPEPPLVASRWDDPQATGRDNWRKELADTARFEPARAAELLLPLDRLPGLVCRGRRVWLVGTAEQAAHVATVPGAQPVFSGRHARLWRAEPRACPAAGA